MKNTKIQRIKLLLEQSKALAGFWDNYQEAIEDPKCLSYDAGFRDEPHYKIFNINQSFNAHTRKHDLTYQLFSNGMLGDVVATYIQRAMNAHAREIFHTAANLIRKDAIGSTERMPRMKSTA